MGIHFTRYAYAKPNGKPATNAATSASNGP